MYQTGPKPQPFQDFFFFFFLLWGWGGRGSSSLAENYRVLSILAKNFTEREREDQPEQGHQ